MTKKLFIDDNETQKNVPEIGIIKINASFPGTIRKVREQVENLKLPLKISSREPMVCAC